MDDFIPMSKRQQRKLSLDEYTEYRKRERAYHYRKGDSIKGLLKCNIWNFILVRALKILRRQKRQRLYILADKREGRKKPVIYACTHVGYDDIAMTFEALKASCWIFLGTPEQIHRTLNGWMVEKNGVVFIDTYDKEDRHIAKETSIQLLKRGGSLMIFPEGIWNLTDALPVMKLYTGVVSMALQTGADVVPIAIEQYGKDFYVNIGENINYLGRTESEKELTQELRDILATLKWEIWEKMGVVSRKSISKNFRENFAKNILIEVNESGGTYTMEQIEAERYHDKDNPDYQTVFAFMETLPWKKETAFLFRDEKKLLWNGTDLILYKGSKSAEDN